jgi:hypothetical protein
MPRRLIQRLADVMAAVAFAEEGEVETARQLLAEADRAEQREPAERRAAMLPASPRPLAKSS